MAAADTLWGSSAAVRLGQVLLLVPRQGPPRGHCKTTTRLGAYIHGSSKARGGLRRGCWSRGGCGSQDWRRGYRRHCLG